MMVIVILSVYVRKPKVATPETAAKFPGKFSICRKKTHEVSWSCFTACQNDRFAQCSYNCN